MGELESTQVFDVIIVGAGTAGCVLANRLSEDPTVSVLVLEAGEDHTTDERVSIPGLALRLLDNPDFDWRYVSEPQPGLYGRQMKHPRGRMLGGSSAINSFALIYPSAAGLDAWEDLGNEGWGWKDMKEYFRKFQTVCPPSAAVSKEVRVVSKDDHVVGPIQGTYPLKCANFQKAWVQTFQTLGLENTEDPRDGHALGGYISTCHVSDELRERSHAGKAYYELIRHRSNVVLITGAHVQKITFDSSSSDPAVATGVEYIKNGTRQHVKAGTEVVMAGGVFATPQILELSGIGKATLLKQHDINILYDNPNVGENLQDHPRAGIGSEIADGVVLRDPMTPEEARKEYFEHRAGPWAESVCSTFAQIPMDHFLSPSEKRELSDLLDEHLDDPSLSEFEQKRNAFVKQMILSPSEATLTMYLASKTPVEDNRGKTWISLFGMLAHPFSRGSSHIASPDVAVRPKIDFEYYTHPLDVEIHARHVQNLVKISRTAPLSEFIKPNGVDLPVDLDNLTLDGAKDVVRRYAMTNYHPCGTCSMMPERMGGVVDHRLRVYGTANVRVVDASIIPIIPRGNIITTVYAVAEKAADLISEGLRVGRVT